MNRFSFLLLLLSACASLVTAASSPTFCKCTCFSNSTIIEIKSTTAGAGTSALTNPNILAELPPLDPPSSTSDTSSEDSSPASDTSPSDAPTNARLLPRGAPKRATASSPSCSQCNKAFCLAQSLPICKGADEKDVATMCFQRDSRKDQIIVWGFILGTAGLLGWAAIRKFWEMRQSAGGIASALLGGGSRGGGVPVGRVGGGRIGLADGGGAASGSDGGRGQYANVAGHSRENSVL